MRLHNSLSGRIEEFTPLHPGEVRMYNCGPTVYKRAHLGNFRAYLLADLLRRTFEYLGWRVHQVMNITDVGHLTEDDVADARGEDKLLAEAKARKVDPWEIAREVEGWFHEDLASLRALPAHDYPRATDHVPQMIAMIEELIAKGHAYEVEGNVYFAVDSFSAYGALSGNTSEALNAGASGRVEERSDKKSPHDFALWKRDEKHLMQWDSPWGRGFPGWHIECSAMSRQYLGDTLDIHTGGPDNKFPHHECEIAQSESVTGKPFVRHWVHCGWLQIDGAKMAKRAGKIFLVPELLEMGYGGGDIRLFLLKQHYRAPLPFHLELLDEAKRIRGKIQHFRDYQLAERPAGEVRPAAREAVEGVRGAIRKALEEDLNTSEALAALHDFMGACNRLEPNAGEAALARTVLKEFDSIFAILDDAPAGKLEAEIEHLIQERDAARKSKDFARSDAIRDRLKAEGIELFDTPQGVRWKRV
ncbi:MAG: cysteine--tRNA ligase [Planctomycetes bacterium]|nr:cysteine--tRNA ligase [Planctomycetota bacterium]